MKIIRPTAITDATLVDSKVPETDRPAWSAGTSYAKDAEVMRAHRRWLSLQPGNLGHDPAASVGFWSDMGPTNRWAMLDETVGTLTEATGRIVVIIAPGAIDALAVLDTTAETVGVTMTVGGTQIYARSQSTNAGGAAIDNWFAYFFEPLGKKTALTFLDLPVYPDCQVTVTLNGPDPAGPVTCGTLIVGRQLSLGSTEAGASIGILDFSRKDTDVFGVTSVVERPYAKRMTARMMLPTDSVDTVQRALAAVRARPVLWIGEEGYDSLAVYGFYKDFSIDIAFAHISYCSLTVEGLI